MEREDRNFHGKRDKESQKEPGRCASKVLDLAVTNCSLDANEIKRAGFSVKPQDRRQHEHRSNHRVQEEFHRCIDTPFVAINSDQQSHRDQSGFPEEVKKEQIKRDKDPNQRSLQNQQQNEKFFYPLMNRFPRDEDTERRQKSGQHHQPHRNTVHTHVVMDIGIRDPKVVDFVLESGLSPLKMYRQVQRKNKIQQRDHESEQTNIAVTPRKQQQQNPTRHRNKRDQREHRVVQGGAHCVPIQIMYAITTAAPAAIQPA